MPRLDDAWQLINLGEPDGVDQRRAVVGLGPLAEYLRGFEDMEVPETEEVSLRCRGCGEQVPFELAEDGDKEPFVVTCGACGTRTTVRAGG